MADRPILFSGPMVQALLAGAKCQTRRLIKGAPVVHPRGTPTWYPSPEHKSRLAYDGPEHFARGMPLDFARWRPDDRLWVRETWRASWHEGADDGALVTYAADDAQLWRDFAGDDIDGWCDREGRRPAGTWRPSIHMPRWASRISLRVTSVRAERLDEIGEADAEAEGVRHAAPTFGYDAETLARLPNLPTRHLFAELWGHVHGEGAWERDRERWVWVVSFERVEEVPRG